jgi:hypothetical protein
MNLLRKSFRFWRHAMRVACTSEACRFSAVNRERISAKFSMKFHSKIELLEKMELLENEART